MPAVLGFMVESPAMGAGIFIPLVAIFCNVSLHLAMFAVRLRFLIHLLTIICLYVFELLSDMIEKQWLALVGSPLGAVGYVRCAGTSGTFQALFSFSFNNADELLQVHLLKQVTCGMMSHLSDVSLSEIVLGGWQRR